MVSWTVNPPNFHLIPWKQSSLFRYLNLASSSTSTTCLFAPCPSSLIYKLVGHPSFVPFLFFLANRRHSYSLWICDLQTCISKRADTTPRFAVWRRAVLTFRRVSLQSFPHARMCMETVKLIFFFHSNLTAVPSVFLAAYSQWSEKFISWPCQSWKGQVYFIFLISPLFHLLQTALCLSGTRLHRFLISFLWPFAALFLCLWLRESESGLLASGPAVLSVHTRSFRLPGWRTGLYFHFSAADGREDAAAPGRRQSFEALSVSGWR